MVLISEFVDFQNLKIIKEDRAADGGGKSIYIEGPFLQAEVENRNKRVYRKPLIIREVNKFNEEKISKNRALGELDHPTSPQINLDRVSHKIELLEMRNDIGYGKAKVLDTPTGRILKTLLEEGIILGVSTRGVGTIDEKSGYVNDDFGLITIDAVADPSAPKAFVDAVMENKEWIMDGDKWVERVMGNMKKSLDKGGSKNAYGAMITFLSDLGKRI